jgi:hypothetical protein
MAETHDSDDFMESAFKMAALFCEELGLDGNTISKVVAANDGAFFVQAASLIEAALNSGLSKRISIRKLYGHLEEDQVISIIERIQMGGANNKVEIALACNLISNSDKHFIEAILSVRNLYVHRFQHYGMTFEALLDSLSEDRRRSLVQKLLPSALRNRLQVTAEKEVAFVQYNARVFLVSFIARVMEFRQPKGILGLLGWESETKDG